jgi:hypothetical protein
MGLGVNVRYLLTDDCTLRIKQRKKQKRKKKKKRISSIYVGQRQEFKRKILVLDFPDGGGILN